MPALQPARGTQDLLPEAARRHRRVSDTAREMAALYGFAEIATPIFEFTEVFSRPIGEHTDIVSKEMYTFTDRGGEEVTLRPENTAGVVRAVLSNGLTQSTPLKFFYSGRCSAMSARKRAASGNSTRSGSSSSGWQRRRPTSRSLRSASGS